MAKKIVITSGKGGVGKTTVTANLGYQLSKLGMRVVIFDGDIGLNNLDLLLNVENLITFDLIDVLNGKCRAKQALVKSPVSENLYIFPCNHTLSSVEIMGQKIKSVIEEIENAFDYVLIDSPAGIDVGFHRAVNCSNQAVIVVTPNITSIRDADKVLGLLKSYGLTNISAVINRIRGDLVASGESYSDTDIENALSVKVSGVIPESDLLQNGIIEYSSSPQKAFYYLAKNISEETTKSYDYLKKYTGFFGSIRRELKKRL